MRNRILLFLMGLFLGVSVRAQSGATLEILTPDVCAPGKVSMRVINCNSCVSFEWEINSGTGYKFGTSDYSTIITDTGWFDVSVKLRTSAGAIFLIGKKKAFYGRMSPVVNISLNKSAFCHGTDTLVVTDNTPNIKSRDWLIDGKVFYYGPKVLVYPMPVVQGYKSIYLLVRDSWDCKGKYLSDSAVSVWDSIRVSIYANKQKGCSPANVNFSFSADTGLHSIKSVKWSFENGSPATSIVRSPKNIYYAIGDSNNVQLTLLSSKGCIYNYQFNKFINLGDTSLLSISLSKTKVCANEWTSAKLSNSKTSLAKWTFGSVAVAPVPIVGNDVKFQFKDTGSSLIVVSEDYKGCISYATAKNTITVEGPLALVTAESPFYCGIPKTLKFNNETKEYPGGNSWQWRLYDSTMTAVANSTTKTFSYYTTKGIKYSVFLKVIGANGCQDSIFLKPASTYGHFDTNLTIEPNPVCPGKQFTAIPTAGAGSKSYPNSYQWWFYDLKGKVVHTDYNEKPVFSYKETGNYTVKMKVSNADNCLDSVTLKDTIHINAPHVDLYVQDTFMCRNQDNKIAARTKFNSSKMLKYWQLFNQDSLGVYYTFFADSVNFTILKTGRYRINYVINDTTKNGCYYNYVYPYTLYVSGLQLKASTDVSEGCPTFLINLTSAVIYNVNYKNFGNSINYFWKPLQTQNVNLNTNNTASVSGEIIGKGKNHIRLIYSNQSGCIDSSIVGINSEFEAGFQLHGNVRCIRQTGFIHNESSPWATKVRYVADSSVIFKPGKSANEPNVVFTKAGVFGIMQIASSGSCIDTLVRFFEITEIKADFYTPDSVSYCAPRLLNIINNTVGSFENTWLFGDGDSAKTYFNDLSGHLYLKNNSRPGYDVQLIAKNQYGCKDTLLKKGYIRLIGPIPDFSVQNIIGCEPLRVKFTNNSLDYSRMFVDYDNGVVYDSAELGTYDYRVTDKALMEQKFLPRILLYDSFGCSTLSISPDTIKVKKSAEALHTFTSINFLRGTEGCAKDLLVKFSNRSKFFVKTYWDFDGDGNTDMLNQSSPNYLYNNAGIFKPIIIAENANGCRDTFQRDSIIVWEPPVANFKSSADTSCAIDPVFFNSTSVFANPVSKYLWNFGETFILSDSSTNPVTKWKYSSPFNHAVKLHVTDIKGCVAEVIKNLYVNDTAGPVKPELVLITVRDDKYVDFLWRKSKLGNFLKYHTYLDSLGLWERYSSYKLGDTIYTANHGNEVFNRRFCYTLRVEDTCDQNGKAAVSHCTIVLRDTATEPFHIKLTWLAYDWWETELSHYEIFRKDPGSSTYNKIVEVKSNRLNYTDSWLCDKQYCYYVEAVHKNREYRSRSNTTCRIPIYMKPDSFVNTELVTIRNNAYTEVYWKPYYKYYKKWSYQLERSSNGMAGSFSPVYSTQSTSGIDVSANVHDRINYYRVRFVDHCGGQAKPGITSNSLWLRFESQNRNNTKLLWNAYSYWHSGVKEYGVQLKKEDGTFSLLRTVPSITTYLDSINIESFNLDSICFRVYAVKDSVTLDTSWSNEICLVPASYVHVPTAFTPNNDALNDVLKPIAAFIHKTDGNPDHRFEFNVFNRWGQKVFSSNNPADGWDGSLLGEKCTSGMYVWSLIAVGYDGVAHRLEGTVYLIR